METQDKLKIGIGNKETANLEAKPVTVEDVQIRLVKDRIEKIVFKVKHPDSDDLIELSSAKYIKGNIISVAGLWLKLDSEDKIQKGSALAITLQYYNAESIEAMKGKELTTELDAKGYLTIKAY